jgi:hypothetical protein
MREEPDGSLVVRRDVESIIRIDKADVLTISSFSPDGNPCSLVDVLRVTAGDIDYLRAKEELNQLERGFHQGLIGSIRTGGMQSNEQLAALREQFQQTYAGVDSGASVLLTGDVDWKPLEMGSLADTQHIDSRRYAAEVMYRVPGIPPVLADISRATYDSAEVQERVFWQHTIVPRCRWLASVFNVSLWPLWDADLVARFDFSQVEALQASMEGKYRTANEMKRLGLPIAVINNKLKLDLPRMDGDDQGDYQSVALEPRISLWPERPATRTASLDLTAGAPSLVLGKGNKLPYRRLNAATIRAYYATWDRLLGKASDGSGFEGSYAKTMGKLLRQQERAIDWEACLAAVRTSGECQPYNRPEWVQKFTDGRLRLQFASFREGAKLGSDEVSAATGKAYKAAPAEINAEVQDALKKRCARWALLQDDTTWRSIQATLSTAITEGWDLNAATVKLSELFSALRAETIARTETASALNAGLDWEYRNSDELWGKEWISTIDERSRDTHAEANGQVVPKDGEFEIGGEKLPYPGYSDASAGNIINCRCTEAPIPLNSESEVGE